MRRFMRWFIVAAAGAAVATVVGLGIASLVTRVTHMLRPAPSPVPQQVDAVVHREARDGMTLAYNAAVDLRPGGERARLLVFRPDYASATAPQALDSAKLEVYDVERGQLRLSLSFRPTSTTIVVRNRKHNRIRWDYDIQVLAAASPVAPGGRAVVLLFGQQYADEIVERPVLLFWSPGQERYVLAPLLTPAAGPFRLVKRPLRAGGGWAPLYGVPTRVVDADGRSRSFISYGGEEFALRRDARTGTTLLLGLFLTESSSHIRINLAQLEVWAIERVVGQSPTAIMCDRRRGNTSSPVPMLFRPRGAASTGTVLKEAWLHFRPSVMCF